jgi:trk system potassium uptake protein TrkH
MSYRSIIYTVSKILLGEASLLTFPAIVAIIYGDNTLFAFTVTIGLLVLAGLSALSSNPKNSVFIQKKVTSLLPLPGF